MEGVYEVDSRSLRRSRAEVPAHHPSSNSSAMALIVELKIAEDRLGRLCDGLRALLADYT